VSHAASILVVSAEPAETTADVLGRFGLGVEHAATVAAAVAACDGARFDAVVTDAHVGRGDGLEVLRHVRAALGDLPVCVLAAAEDDEAQLRAAALGASRYLKHPVDDVLLAQSLLDLIERRRRRGAAAPGAAPGPGERDHRDVAELRDTLARLARAADHDRLGVPAGADAGGIRRSFHRLARRYHPDRFARSPLAEAPALAHEIYLLLTKAEQDLLARARSAPPKTEASLPPWVPDQQSGVPASSRPPNAVLSSAPPSAPRSAPGHSPAPRHGPESERAHGRGSSPTPSDTGRPGARLSPAPHLGPDTEPPRLHDVPTLRAPPSAPGPSSAPDPPATFERGKRALDRGAWRDARNLFAHCTRLDGGNKTYRAHHELAQGLVLLEEGREADADAHLEAARRLDRSLGRDAVRQMVSRSGSLFSRLLKR
jgi:CheY-like chemotaxis protein